MRLPGPPLPVDAVLPRVVAALGEAGIAVLQAPTGAGKTTRVPLALLDADWLDGTVVMLEPRRIAARAAARRLAAQLGERVGETVGLRVRGETRVGRSTRIEVVTEGVLTRRLMNDPDLTASRAVSALVFDEVHERSLQTDLGLALALQARELLRPDLRILAMSATLDGDRFSDLLGGAPIVTSEGRAYPVEPRYLGTPQATAGGRPPRIEDGVAAAVRRALDEETGSVLAFLPGSGEIRRTAERLAGLGRDVMLAPLYGDLGARQQDAAIEPAPTGMRKVVLATSIAETSLTIEGVRVVVDAGLARRPRFDAASGMSRLETVRVSRAEADQRLGRAGRTEPGVGYRLWSEVEHAALRPHAPAEMTQADLAPLALALAAWGAAPDDLGWIDPPPAAAFETARELLRELDALDAGGALTAHGLAIAALPMHPRLAHLGERARALGQAALGADLVGLLSERDVFRWDGRLPDVDLRLRVEALRGDVRGGNGVRLDRGALDRARHEGMRWRRAWDATDAPADLDAAGPLLALAYPDRVAQRVGESAEGARYRLREGRAAILDRAQPLADAPFLAVGDLDDRRGGARVFTAAPIDASEIESLFADQIVDEDDVAWDASAGRVVAQRVRRLGAVVLSQAPIRTPAPHLVTAGLVEGVRQSGLGVLPWSKETARLRERLAFLNHHLGDPWPDVSDDALLATLPDWLGPYLAGMTRLSDLGRLDLGMLLRQLGPPSARTDLDRLAPSHVTVPSGSVRPLDYSDPEAPVLAVRLQEVFGLEETPRVLDGRLPVLMHLLSPAQRPVQVTADLRSFWRDAYFDVRKDMRGRYPKHHWPENPLEATPTARAKRRR
ncbi:ATP-dependent helicase HrpB [Rubrivirga sp. IMCC45206]|uniref:ATP-dependent helicase HrpB n=1 Tax=Rubrivirga sp. IMCC45206 TaxID=3391614 RepID=UPI00398FF6AA